MENDEHRAAIAHVLTCRTCIETLAKMDSFAQHSRAGSSKKSGRVGHNGGRPEAHKPDCARRIAKERAKTDPRIAKHHYVTVDCTCGVGSNSYSKKHPYRYKGVAGNEDTEGTT